MDTRVKREVVVGKDKSKTGRKDNMSVVLLEPAYGLFGLLTEKTHFKCGNQKTPS